MYEVKGQAIPRVVHGVAYGSFWSAGRRWDHTGTIHRMSEKDFRALEKDVLDGMPVKILSSVEIGEQEATQASLVVGVPIEPIPVVEPAQKWKKRA